MDGAATGITKYQIHFNVIPLRPEKQALSDVTTIILE